MKGRHPRSFIDPDSGSTLPRNHVSASIGRSGVSKCTMPLRRFAPTSMSISGRTEHLFSIGIRCVLIAIILGVLSGGNQAHGQELRIGVRTGPAFGFLNNNVVPFVSADEDTKANTNVRLDLHASVFAVVPVGGRFGVRPELTFVQKGAHFSRTGVQYYTSERYRLSYVQGQILGQRSISLSGPLSGQITGGFSVDRALSGAVQRDTWHRGVEFDERIGLVTNDLVQRWDIGAVIGIGLEYALRPSRHVSLTLRYNPGFRSVFTDNDRSNADDGQKRTLDPPTLSESPPRLRHDLLTVGLSYTFRLIR